MEKFSQKIEEYVRGIIQKLEDINSEDFLIDIAKDLKFNLLFKLLMEELTEVALKENKIVNSFIVLKSISRNSSQRLYPEFIQQVKPKEVPGKECEEIFNNITLFKGTLLRMIEKMKLIKSRAHLIKSLVLNDSEINASLIYTESEIKSFNSDDFEVILREELNEKYKDKPLIIKQR
ncbi:MAG: hypothetical protein AABX52_01125 [Nanoarchaeota archaeon]